MGWSPPGSSIRGILQARILEWVSISFSRRSSQPRDRSQWGYTVHTCEGCGYHWTDSYTPPQHTPGAWEATDRVSETGGSIEQRVCTVCGEVTEERMTSDGVSAFDAVSPSDTKGLFGWNKKTAAIGGSSALLLTAAAGIILLFRKKKNRR